MLRKWAKMTSFEKLFFLRRGINFFENWELLGGGISPKIPFAGRNQAK